MADGLILKIVFGHIAQQPIAEFSESLNREVE